MGQCGLVRILSGRSKAWVGNTCKRPKPTGKRSTTEYVLRRVTYNRPNYKTFYDRNLVLHERCACKMVLETPEYNRVINIRFEFVALKIAVEMNDGLRYRIRMFGIPLDGPTNGFCDNESVVHNATIPESTLQKKYNSIAYHKCRESVAQGALRIKHERGKFNCCDILTS